MPETRSAGGVAEGVIRVGRGVKQGTAEGGLLECDANEAALGISFRDTRRSDYVASTDASNAVHANTGEPVGYYTSGARCWAVAGGTITAGDYLETDADGQMTTSSTDKHKVVAKALSGGVSGDWIRVEVLPPGMERSV